MPAKNSKSYEVLSPEMVTGVHRVMRSGVSYLFSSTARDEISDEKYS